jgi:putative transposase
MHCDIYNAAVSHRQTQYKKFGKSVNYFDQQNSLPELIDRVPEYKELTTMALQGTLKRVDFAFNRFFKKLAKYPRFKSKRRYRGWTYPDARQGFKVHSTGDHGYLELSNIGQIRMRGKARIWGIPTSCTIVWKNNKWYVSITLKVDDELLKKNRPLGNNASGIDFGCKSAAVISTLRLRSALTLSDLPPSTGSGHRRAESRGVEAFAGVGNPPR